MNYLLYQQLLTTGVDLLVIALLSLLLLQWGLGLLQPKPAGQRFAAMTAAQPWWVRIRTTSPSCIYYFGPFRWRWMARQHQQGYHQDLLDEQAQGIEVTILQDEPKQLTRCEEWNSD